MVLFDYLIVCRRVVEITGIWLEFFSWGINEEHVGKKQKDNGDTAAAFHSFCGAETKLLTN